MYGIFVSNFSFANELVFGLVGKSIDDDNFIEACRGCSEIAKSRKDECVLIGAKGPANPHSQSKALLDALKTKRFAALAISVTDSATVAKTLQTVKIPIITFDSSFKSKDEHISRSYIGPNNFEFGRDLAKIAKKFRPHGGSICLMTSANDPNLAQRMRGVRQELSGKNNLAEGLRLNGEGGWTESIRCPWNANDNLERSMEQMRATLSHIKPDVFLSVGHWPVVDNKAYRLTIKPFREDIISKKIIVIVAVGKISTDYSALMRELLVHGFVSINYNKIGRMCYQQMRAAVDGKHVSLKVYTSNIIQIAP